MRRGGEAGSRESHANWTGNMTGGGNKRLAIGQAPEAAGAIAWKSFADWMGDRSRKSKTAEPCGLDGGAQGARPGSGEQWVPPTPSRPFPASTPPPRLPPPQVLGSVGVCLLSAGSFTKALTLLTLVPRVWPQQVLSEHLRKPHATGAVMTPCEKTKPSTCAGWTVRVGQPISSCPQESSRRAGDHQRPGRQAPGEVWSGCHLTVGLAKRRVAWPGSHRSYPLSPAGVGAHSRGEVMQLLANLSGEVAALQAIRAEGGGRRVPGCGQ